MSQSIFQKLKKLKSIVPDKEYSRVSLAAILLNTPPKPLGIFETLLFRISLVVTVFAVIIFGAVRSDTPMKLAGLDQQGLKAEAEELELQLRLTEISINQDQDGSAVAALKEAAQNSPGHLNTSIIKNESPMLDATEYSNPGVDEALKALTE